MFSDYPDFKDVTLDMRPTLHPLFRGAGMEISEFTFANIYLFRDAHNYKISRLGGGDSYIITGSDGGKVFFMLPFGLPEGDLLGDFFERFGELKNATEDQAMKLAEAGYGPVEDRDNFDYIYLKADLESLSGRKFHRKKNLVNYFTGHYSYEGRPLLDELIPHALGVLERWKEGRLSSGEGPGDYTAAAEALDRCSELQLCGGIYYVDGQPAAYTLGEEIRDDTFVIHFEKALSGFKGLPQFVNQSFASILPDKYTYINMEQDLGDEGMRQAKTSYRPAGFVKKFRVRP